MPAPSAAEQAEIEAMLQDLECDGCSAHKPFKDCASLSPQAMHGICRDCWYRGKSAYSVIIGNTSCVACQRSPVEKEKLAMGCLCGTYHGLCEECWASDPAARWAEKFPAGHTLWHRDFGVLELRDLARLPYPDSLRDTRPPVEAEERKPDSEAKARPRGSGARVVFTQRPPDPAPAEERKPGPEAQPPAEDTPRTDEKTPASAPETGAARGAAEPGLLSSTMG